MAATSGQFKNKSKVTEIKKSTMAEDKDMKYKVI